MSLLHVKKGLLVVLEVASDVVKVYSVGVLVLKSAQTVAGSFAQKESGEVGRGSEGVGHVLAISYVGILSWLGQSLLGLVGDAHHLGFRLLLRVLLRV